MTNSIKSIITGFFSGKKKNPFFLKIQEILGFEPNNIEYYQHAFIHSSMVERHSALSNERMEYLGDAILGAVVADIVYHKFPNRDEGFLTRARIAFVQRKALDEVSLKLGLNELIITQKNLKIDKDSHINGNAFEALIAAIYLDKGYEACKKFMLNLIDKGFYDILDLLAEESRSEKLQDTLSRPPRMLLNEWGQKYRHKVEFVTDNIIALPEKGVTVIKSSVFIDGQKIAEGVGNSKKEAYGDAAQKALDLIEEKKMSINNNQSRKNQNNGNYKTKTNNNQPKANNNQAQANNKQANANDKQANANDNQPKTNNGQNANKNAAQNNSNSKNNKQNNKAANTK